MIQSIFKEPYNMDIKPEAVSLGDFDLVLDRKGNLRVFVEGEMIYRLNAPKGKIPNNVTVTLSSKKNSRKK